PGQAIQLGTLTCLEGVADRVVHPCVAPGPPSWVPLHETSRSRERVAARARPERRQVDAGGDDERPPDRLRHELLAPPQHVAARSRHGACAVETLAGQIAAPPLLAHRVLQVAAVDLRHEPVTQGAPGYD